MLDGRMWWELRKAGEPEKRILTPDQVAKERNWLDEKIKRLNDGGKTG